MTRDYDVAVEKTQTKIKKAMEMINEYIRDICHGTHCCEDCPFYIETFVVKNKCYRDYCIYDLVYKICLTKE